MRIGRNYVFHGGLKYTFLSLSGRGMSVVFGRPYITIGRAFGTLCRLSVCLSVTFCIVAKRYVLVKNCLKE